jgi:glycosyltransferase involved in cell wall biosynthesis
MRRVVGREARNRRVVHLTTVHGPFDVRIFHKQCRTLLEAGYEVEVVAPHTETAVVEGIRIVPLRLFRSRIARMVLGVPRAFATALGRRAKVYHLHDPELLPIGVLLRATGARVIYDVHEDYPQNILTRQYLPRVLRHPIAAVVRMIEWLATRVFDGVVAATPGIARRFPSGKTVTVMNYPRLAEFGAGVGPTYQEREPHIAYVGVIDRNRGAFEMVRAMSQLPASATRLLMGGRFSPSDLNGELSRVPGWERVEFLGWLDRHAVAKTLARARVALLVLQPTPAYLDSYPVKLFEYMAAELPVVASDFPLWREILGAADAGVLVDPGNPQAIASAISRLLDDPASAEAMGRRGRRAVEERYTWEATAASLMGLYARLVQPVTGR